MTSYSNLIGPKHSNSNGFSDTPLSGDTVSQERAAHLHLCIFISSVFFFILFLRSIEYFIHHFICFLRQFLN